MCDYSLHAVRHREAEIHDVLMSTKFQGTITRGFCTPEDQYCAICLKPGTEVVFESYPKKDGMFFFRNKIKSKMATFRKINTEICSTHHDALEFDNGQIVLLSQLVPGYAARIVQMPVTCSFTDTEFTSGVVSADVRMSESTY